LFGIEIMYILCKGKEKEISSTFYLLSGQNR